MKSMVIGFEVWAPDKTVQLKTKLTTYICFITLENCGSISQVVHVLQHTYANKINWSTSKV